MLKFHSVQKGYKKWFMHYISSCLMPYDNFVWRTCHMSWCAEAYFFHSGYSSWIGLFGVQTNNLLVPNLDHILHHHTLVFVKTTVVYSWVKRKQTAEIHQVLIFDFTRFVALAFWLNPCEEHLWFFSLLKWNILMQFSFTDRHRSSSIATLEL